MTNQELTVGDFYEDEYGSLYEITSVKVNTVSLNRLRDDVTQTLCISTVKNWISNKALTVYLTAEEVSS